MPHDDYFRIVFIILKSLYEYKKAHKKFDLDEISAEVLKINEGYRDEILEEMLDSGYVKGFKVKQYIAGKHITGLSNIDITERGIEYLSENSNMKKVYAILKETRDWIPGI